MPKRVLLAKVGLDGHDRGIKIIARALRDAGMEVIYTGLHKTPTIVVNIALDEDVDAIGISVLSGAHMTIFSDVLALLEKNEASEIVVFGGGIIPAADVETLYRQGVAQLFTPGCSLGEITRWAREFL